MRLRFSQLEAHLAKRLAPVYVVAGEEPWQAMQAADAIRAAARTHGHNQREVLHVEPGFDWTELDSITRNLSLFGERRLLDLHMPAGKPGRDGARALTQYAAAPPADNLLLLRLGKVDRTSANAAWFKALEKAGVLLQVWPLSPAETQTWIQGRLRARGLTADDQAIEYLTMLVEGNLLAAAQEVDKLRLNHGAAHLDQPAIAAAVTRSARHDVFDLAEAVLAGEPLRAVRILYGLRAEAAPDSLILWALTDQLRALAVVAQGMREGKSLAAASQNVWQRRRPLIQRALKRHGQAGVAALLRRAACADRVIKGRGRGRPEDELLQLAVMIAGALPVAAAGDEASRDIAG